MPCFRVGVHNVVGSDIRAPPREIVRSFVEADVTDKITLDRTIKEHGITYIIHLASLLSGSFCGVIDFVILKSL